MATTDPDKDKGGAGNNPPPQPKEKPKRVRVILEKGTLGHLHLKKGDSTEDADYAELLKTRRGRTLVEEVK